MNRKIRSIVEKQREIGERQNNSYLAVLSKIRNMTGVCSLDEMKNREHREAVKNAINALNVDDFTIRQWRIAANYFIGKKTEIIKSKQAFEMIIKELSKKE